MFYPYVIILDHIFFLRTLGTIFSNDVWKLLRLFIVFYTVYLQDTSVPKSKYEEDVYINNHTSVWGSWWKDHQWGYKCCKQTIKNSYCTGLAGIEAAEASADLMKANMAREEAAEGMTLLLHSIFLEG